MEPLSPKLEFLSAQRGKTAVLQATFSPEWWLVLWTISHKDQIDWGGTCVLTCCSISYVKFHTLLSIYIYVCLRLYVEYSLIHNIIYIYTHIYIYIHKRNNPASPGKNLSELVVSWRLGVRATKVVISRGKKVVIFCKDISDL